MNFTILVNAAPYSQQGAHTAYHYCQALLAKGHKITRLFFYRDGVLNGNAFIAPPQDEINLVNAWQELAQEYHLELIVCVTAASRRGIADESNLATGFKISGLGQLIEAMTQADRFVVFN